MTLPVSRLSLVCLLAPLLAHTAVAQDDPWGYDLDRGASAVLAPADAGLPEAVAPMPSADYSSEPAARGPVNPGAPGGAPGVPADGGVALLALAGAVYAARRLRGRGAIASALVLAGGGAQAQAVLSPGDIVVTAFYSNEGSANGTDNFGLIATVDLPQGTTFRITDGGWDGTAIREDNTPVTSGSITYAGGNIVDYTAPCDIPAGTAFDYRYNGTRSNSTFVCPIGGPAAGSNAGTGFAAVIPVNGFTGRLGDQILIYQNAANTGDVTGAGTAFPRFIFAATEATDFVAPGTALTDATTQLPPLLRRGSTAIFLPSSNSVYNGTGTSTPTAPGVGITANATLRTGSRGQILLNIGNVASNWTGNSTNSTANAGLAPALQTSSFTVDGNAVLGAATAVGGPGWRNLSVPGAGLTVGRLASYTPDGGTTRGVNFIQGLSNEMPIGTNGLPLIPTIYLGYNGDNLDQSLRSGGFRNNNLGFVPPNDTTIAVTPGKGVLWYFFDVAAGPFAAQNGRTVSRVLPLLLPALGTEITTNQIVTYSADERTSARDGTVRPNGLYFLGNPYQKAFDLSGLTETTAATIQSAFSFWDPNAGGASVAAGNGTPGSYVVRNSIDDTPNSASDDVQVWQGFYAEVSGITGTTTFPRFRFAAASRVDASRPTFYGRDAGADSTVTVTFVLSGTTSEGPTYDEAAQLFASPAGQDGWDPYDLSDLGTLGYPVATLRPVATGPEGEADYALSQRSIRLDALTTTPLRLTVEEAGGDYSLGWRTANLPDGWTATVRDTETGEIRDLRADATLDFSAAVGSSDRFVVTLGRSAVAADEPAVEATLALSAPAPNPASATTRLALTSSGGPTTAMLYDALGRRVAVLFEGDLAAGTRRTLSIDAARFAPGVYVVRATSGGRAATQRLAVVR